MYRPPSRAPKGDWANHLHAERRRRDLSQNQAFELMRERLHMSPRSRASYAAIDMGDRQPRPEEAEVLASEFGWPPEGLSGAAGAAESVDAVAAAIREQTQAMVAVQSQILAALEAQTAMLSEALNSGVQVKGLLDWAAIERQRVEAGATRPQRPKSNNRPEPARRP